MRRFQFSLRKLLLVIAAVMVVVSHVSTSLKLRRAEQELHDLRIEQGILVVEDATRIQVVRVELQQPMTWRWRIYLPPGQSYHAALDYGDIPLDGFPDYGSDILFLREGENTITAKVQRDERGAWRVTIYNDSGEDSFGIPQESATWLEDFYERSSFQSVVQAESFKADAPVELLRIAADIPPDESSLGASTRYEGILIWIEGSPTK